MDIELSRKEALKKLRKIGKVSLDSLAKKIEKSIYYAEEDTSEIIRKVLSLIKDNNKHLILEYFLKQYNFLDVKLLYRDVKSLYRDVPSDIKKCEKDSIIKVLDKFQDKKAKYRKTLIEFLSNNEDLNKFIPLVKNNNFFTKQEKINFGIKTWDLVNNKSIYEYAFIFVLICRPLEIEDSVQLSEFFEIVFKLKNYFEFEDYLFEKAILIFLEMFYIKICDDASNYNRSYLTEFYPFTTHNITKLVRWLIGKDYLVDSNDGSKLYYTAKSPCLEIFCDRILNAVVPGKFNIQSMMIEYWIKDSSRLIQSCFGLNNADYIKNHLSEFIKQYEPKELYDFEYDEDYCQLTNIADAIKKNAPLTGDILNELNRFSLKNQLCSDIIDNYQISSFSAAELSQNFKEINISCDNVDFYNSFIVINYKVNELKQTYKHYCKSSSKIKTDNDDNLFDYVKSSFPLIHCATINGKIVKILNEEQINNSIEALNKAVNFSNNLYKKNHTNNFSSTLSLSTKNKCVKFLNEIKLKKYPVETLKERYFTNSGVEILEDAAIFVISEINNMLTIVYENSSIARSTYIFSIEKSVLNVAINKIKSFFSSELINKRQRLISDKSMFKIEDGIFSVKRIQHQDLDIWKEEILNCF